MQIVENIKRHSCRHIAVATDEIQQQQQRRHLTAKMFKIAFFTSFLMLFLFFFCKCLSVFHNLFFCTQLFLFIHLFVSNFFGVLFCVLQRFRGVHLNVYAAVYDATIMRAPPASPH